jgi:tetratricopeptide (TPR) repeat protein
MSDTTATNLFMYSPLLGKYAGFYQGLLQGVASYEQLGNRLIQQGEQAHAFRQFDKVQEIGQLLSNIPIKHYQAIGYYFLAVAANSMGNGDQDKARKLFEIVSNNAPQQYKAKAILSLAAISAHKSDFDSEMRYLLEGLKASPNLAITLSAYRGIAIVKAKEGYHKQALKDLEQIQSLIRFASPLGSFDYLNSLAVELGIAGRKDEARNISQLVLASPFAYAYPEWQDTAEDLKGPNRSFVVIDPSPFVPRNVLRMPAFERDNAEPPSWAGQPAQVVNYELWKKKMAKRKKRNGDKKKPYDEMNEKEMFFEIMNLYSSEDTTDEQRHRIFDAVVRIMSEPDTPEPNEPKPDDPKGA